MDGEGGYKKATTTWRGARASAQRDNQHCSRG